MPTVTPQATQGRTDKHEKLPGCCVTVKLHNCSVFPDMVWHRHISPISAGQSHQLAADRDSDPPSWQPRGQLLRHTLRLPCICCGKPKAMEPAAGAFMGTGDSRPLQDTIKDSSSLHPVTIPNCLTCRALVMTLFMLRHVRNCRRYYYHLPLAKH